MITVVHVDKIEDLTPLDGLSKWLGRYYFVK